MLFVRQPKFILRADHKLIPIISAKDGSLLTNEYINDVQSPLNRVYACRDEQDKGMIRLVRYAEVMATVGANTERFHQVSVGARHFQMDAILLTTELNKTFAQMLRTIGLEQEVPAMLPSRWLTI